MHPSTCLISIANFSGARTLPRHCISLVLATIAALGILSEVAAEDSPKASPSLRLQAAGTKDQDDACIWVHPQEGAASVVIGSDKSAGKIVVYDLQGRVLQSLPVTKPGNIDLRQGVRLDGFTGDLVVVNQRSGGFRLQVYRLDPATRTLDRIDDDQLLTGPNYGGCLYHSHSTGKLYFLCTAEAGKVEQHEIVGDGKGRVSGWLARSWQMQKCEGAVADDATGAFYIAEEKGGLWKFPAEPEQPAEGTRFSGVGEHGITGDLEGVTIYRQPDQPGRLIVSDQGRDRFLVFSLAEPHSFEGEFSIEGAEATDGIDVTSANLGPDFPMGLFICHTDRAPRPLLVTPWQKISLRR